MPQMHRDPLQTHLASMLKKSAAGANDNEYCSAVVLSSTPIDELQSLTARVLRSHLQPYSLQETKHQWRTACTNIFTPWITTCQTILRWQFGILVPGTNWGAAKLSNFSSKRTSFRSVRRKLGKSGNCGVPTRVAS